MYLPDKSGIICDWCSTKFQYKFTYYSVDFRTIDVDVGATYTAPDIKTKLDLDICEVCFKEWTTKITDLYEPDQLNKIKCDWCTKWYTGAFSYTYSEFTEVSVEINQQSSEDSNRSITAQAFSMRLGDCCYPDIPKRAADTRKKTEEWQ